MNTRGTPIAPRFEMDITIGASPDTRSGDAVTPAGGIVEDVIGGMARQAAAYLAAHPEADAYALRLTAIPISVEAES